MSAPNSKQVKEKSGARMLAILKDLTGKNPGILAAQVCTSDGFEVASVEKDEESHRRLAAMVSSLHALGAAMVQEMTLGQALNVIIEATAGKCLMMSIPGSDESLLLAAVADPNMLFGRFHQACRATCDDLGSALKAA